jgi:hypothetical protein
MYRHTSHPPAVQRSSVSQRTHPFSRRSTWSRY